MRALWLTAVAVVVATGPSQPPQATTEGLATIAEGAFTAENQYLVDGVARPAPPAYAAWLAARRADLDTRRDALGDLAYLAQRTVLRSVEESAEVGTRAFVRVTIESVLDLGGVDGAPPYTASVVPVRCWFVLRDGAWVLDRTENVYPV